MKLAAGVEPVATLAAVILAATAVTVTAGRVEWRLHAWSVTSGAKIDAHNDTASLPDSEELGFNEICRAVSSLPPDAHLLAVSGSAFHPALNSFCRTFNVTCVFLDALEGERVPDDWRHNAIRFFPAPELRSRSIYEYITWAMWSNLVVFYSSFDNLDKVQTLLNYPMGPALFRPLNMSRPAETLHQLHRLRRSTLYRFVVDMPTEQLPSFFKLAKGAGLTGMAHSFLLISEVNETFFRRHVALRLNNGVNFTTHQLDSIRFIGESVDGATRTRSEALEILLESAYKNWREGSTPTLADRLELERLPQCRPPLAIRAGQFRHSLEKEICNRVGVVWLEGVRHYNFSFAVRHMSGQELPSGLRQANNIKFADWTLDRGYHITDLGLGMDEMHFKLSMNDLNITVATVIDPPFSLERSFDENGNRLTGNDRWTGLAIELFKEVARRLNISYTIRISSDGQFGSPIENDSGEQIWSGTVGDLMAGTADVAVASLVITYDRERVVDFTTPYMSLGLSVIMKKPEQQTDPLQFMLPFSGRVWTYMLLAWLLTSLLMLVCARLSPYEWYSHSDCVPVVENQFGALNSMWFTIGSLMQQGSDLAPRASSTRMVATTWWFFTLLLISSYTANLAAFLTTNRLGTIDSVDALASQSKVKFGCPTGGAMYNFFKNSRIPMYRKMWDSMQAWSASNESFVRKTSEGISRVRRGGYAYILESTFNKYYRERDCELTQIGGIFNPSSYAFAVRQGNAFLRKELGEVILQLHKEQFIEDLSDAWIKRFNLSGPPCSEAEDDTSPTGTLDVVSFGGVFVSMLAGLGIAVALCFVELLWSCCTQAQRTQRPFLDLLVEHLRLAIRLKVNQKLMSSPPSPCACVTGVNWDALPLETDHGGEGGDAGAGLVLAAVEGAMEVESPAIATESPAIATSAEPESSDPAHLPVESEATVALLHESNNEANPNGDNLTI